MKVLVACEFSGIVREAFKKIGHDAWSCDLIPTEIPGKHIQHDVLDVIYQNEREINFKGVPHSFDLMIAHPPCTHLAVSGARWFKNKQKEQKDAIDFFMKLINAPIEKICVENPVSIMSTKYRKPDQYIQPWQFGHKRTKKTCLWLKNLPLLKPTKIVEPEYILYGSKKNKSGVSKYDKLWGPLPPSDDRGKLRSTTFYGIAEAMAKQWGFRMEMI